MSNAQLDVEARPACVVSLKTDRFYRSCFSSISDIDDNSICIIDAKSNSLKNRPCSMETFSNNWQKNGCNCGHALALVSIFDSGVSGVPAGKHAGIQALAYTQLGERASRCTRILQDRSFSAHIYSGGPGRKEAYG